MSAGSARERHRDRPACTTGTTTGTSDGVGWEWRTFGQYLSGVERAGAAINIAPLVGHGALRLAAMGFAERAATEARARAHGAAARRIAAGRRPRPVDAGSCTRRAASPTPTSSCACAASWRATRHLHDAHPRRARDHPGGGDRGHRHRAARRRAPSQISHNAPKWGAPDDAAVNLALIEAARAEGLDVDHRQRRAHRPGAAPLAGAAAARAGPRARRAHGAAARPPRAATTCAAPSPTTLLPGAGYTGLVRHGRFDRIVILHAGRHPELRGHSVAQIADQRGRAAFDTYLDLILEEDDDVVAHLRLHRGAQHPRAAHASAVHGVVGRPRHAAARAAWTTRVCTGRAATANTPASSSATCASRACCASRRPSAR